jgi:hypothetical protein
VRVEEAVEVVAAWGGVADLRPAPSAEARTSERGPRAVGETPRGATRAVLLRCMAEGLDSGVREESNGAVTLVGRRRSGEDVVRSAGRRSTPSDQISDSRWLARYRRIKG